MLRTRVIPCLLLRNSGLVKTIKFKNPSYVGDPINTVRIYNEKEVDELIFLDITATPERKEPQFKLVSEIAVECFMPFAYGGGIRCLEDIRRVFSLGAEKITLIVIPLRILTSSVRQVINSVAKVLWFPLMLEKGFGVNMRFIQTESVGLPALTLSSMLSGWSVWEQGRFC